MLSFWTSFNRPFVRVNECDFSELTTLALLRTTRLKFFVSLVSQTREEKKTQIEIAINRRNKTHKHYNPISNRGEQKKSQKDSPGSCSNRSTWWKQNIAKRTRTPFELPLKKTAWIKSDTQEDENENTQWKKAHCERLCNVCLKTHENTRENSSKPNASLIYRCESLLQQRTYPQ